MTGADLVPSAPTDVEELRATLDDLGLDPADDLDRLDELAERDPFGLLGLVATLELLIGESFCRELLDQIATVRELLEFAVVKAGHGGPGIGAEILRRRQ